MSVRNLAIPAIVVGCLVGMIFLAAVLRTERDVSSARRSLYGFGARWEESAALAWPDDATTHRRAERWRRFLSGLPGRVNDGLDALEEDPELWELGSMRTVVLRPSVPEQILDFGLTLDGAAALEAILTRAPDAGSHPNAVRAALRLSAGLRAVGGVDCSLRADRLEDAAVARLRSESKDWVWNRERLRVWAQLIDETRARRPSVEAVAEVEVLVAQATLLGLCGIRPFCDVRDEWHHSRPTLSPALGLDVWPMLTDYRDRLLREFRRTSRDPITSEYRVWWRFAVQQCPAMLGLLAPVEALPVDLERADILLLELELRLHEHQQREGRYPDQLGELWLQALAPDLPTPSLPPPIYRALDGGSAYELGSIVSESPTHRE